MSVGDLIPWRNRGSLSKTTERDPFFALHDQIERVFDDFTRGFGVPSLGERGIGWPSVDVKEDEKRFCVEAELPGLDKDDIEVVMTDNVLTIRGEKRVEQDDSKRHYSERYFGQFERRIPLNAEVEAEQIEANFKNGVLKVQIPKSQRAQERARKIMIR